MLFHWNKVETLPLWKGVKETLQDIAIKNAITDMWPLGFMYVFNKQIKPKLRKIHCLKKISVCESATTHSNANP